MLALGASVCSARSSRLGLVSATICSQKSTNTRLSWKMVWSKMYSAASQVVDPLGQRRHRYPVGHVLGVDRADGVVVPADAADAAGDEVRITRVLALHEDAVAAEDGGSALALDHLAVVEVYLRVDPEVPDDAGDRVPRHLREVPG